jgi:hypothetical protein
MLMEHPVLQCLKEHSMVSTLGIGNISCVYESSMYMLCICTSKHYKKPEKHTYSFGHTPLAYKISNSPFIYDDS